MVPTPTVGWALCQSSICPTHTAHAKHHIKVEVFPWARIKPDACPQCGGELRLDLIYGRVPEVKEESAEQLTMKLDEIIPQAQCPDREECKTCTCSEINEMDDGR
jgi:hypothetical protein